MAGDRQVKEAIVLTFFYYAQRPIEEMALKVYYQDLADLEPGAVVRAYDEWRRNPGNRKFPLPTDIRALLSPEMSDDGKARDAAARVLGAVPKFGSYRVADARAYVGELGWEAMTRVFGTWESLCAELTAKQISTYQAQLRDLSLAILEQGRKRAGAPALPPGIQPSRPQLEQRRSGTGEFKSVGDLLNSMPIDAKRK